MIYQSRGFLFAQSQGNGRFYASRLSKSFLLQNTKEILVRFCAVPQL